MSAADCFLPKKSEITTGPTVLGLQITFT